MTTRTYYRDGQLIRTLRWTRPNGTLYTNADLNDMMLAAVEVEDYEKAAKIRDELARRKDD